ncbi:MAG: GlxA family transcriptional regulator [Gemmatimonadales bacterium]
MRRRRIGILGYDGIQALDLVGPAEAFAAAPTDADGLAYEVVILGLERRKFTAETGITMFADTTIASRLRLDTIIVPGGEAMRRSPTDEKTARWLAGRAGSARRIASVCTGVYGLAPTGLLDRRRVTTHWRFARDLAQRYPALRVDSDALFIKDGSFYTSAGITAGIDLALALIEEDLGPTAALAVARELVVYLKRPGGQQQFSEPLQFQTRSTDRFADLTTWMAGHLDADLSVPAQAARVFLCARQFSRVFTKVHGTTPGAFVEELRLGEASRRLASRRVSVDAVAHSVGYRNADVFRRAFERRFGVSPSKYRARFNQQSRSSSRVDP